MNFFHFSCLRCSSYFSMIRFFSLKMCLPSPWSFGNKAPANMSTSNFILATIVSDSNKSSSISCFSAFFNILCHLMWKSSLIVSIAGVFLMRSPKGVTSFERLSLNFFWSCSNLKAFWKSKPNVYYDQYQPSQSLK